MGSLTSAAAHPHSATGRRGGGQGYARRRPEESILYGVVQEQLETFLAHVIYEPGELVEKLAAIVPPPRFHLVRTHGILGPCASERDRVVPVQHAITLRDPPVALPQFGSFFDARPRPDGNESREPASDTRSDSIAAAPAEASTMTKAHSETSPVTNKSEQRSRGLAWAALLRRVFAVDVLKCSRCGGRMRLQAVIHSPDATRVILDCLGLPARAPPMTVALPDEFDLDSGFEAGADRRADADFDFGA